MNAYDYVNWDFVYAFLRFVGVLEVMVRWIEERISNTPP